MNRIAIGIGSNSDNADSSVNSAIVWCSEIFSNVVASSVYITDPVGKKAISVGRRYSNAVIVGNTPLSKDEIITSLKDYENNHGRTLASRSTGIVTIDLDLVIYNDEILKPTDINRDYFRLGFEEIGILNDLSRRSTTGLPTSAL